MQVSWKSWTINPNSRVERRIQLTIIYAVCQSLMWFNRTTLLANPEKWFLYRFHIFNPLREHLCWIRDNLVKISPLRSGTRIVSGLYQEQEKVILTVFDWTTQVWTADEICWKSFPSPKYWEFMHINLSAGLCVNFSYLHHLSYKGCNGLTCRDTAWPWHFFQWQLVTSVWSFFGLWLATCEVGFNNLSYT